MNASGTVRLPDLLLGRADQHQGLSIGQPFALRGAAGLPGSETTLAHRQGLAQDGEREGAALRLDPGIFTATPSRNMPQLFYDLQLHLLGGDLLGSDRVQLARLCRPDPVAQCLLDRPQLLGDTGDAAHLVRTLDGLLLELGRVFLFRDAFHLVLSVVVSLLRRLRGRRNSGDCSSSPAHRSNLPLGKIHSKCHHAYDRKIIELE